MAGYITREQLEGGQTLLQLKEMFQNDKTQQNFFALLTCIMDSVVWVPAKLIMSDQDMELVLNGQLSEALTSADQIRMLPELFENEAGERYYPFFSDLEQIPEDYQNKNSLIAMTGFECARRARGAKGAAGVVLDPFTNLLTIPIQLLSYMDQLQSRLSPEQQAEDLEHPIKDMKLVLPKASQTEEERIKENAEKIGKIFS